MARLEFPNGHLEWLTVQNQAQFLEALRSAHAQAPEIPEVVPQATPSPASKTALGSVPIIILGVGGCVLVGMCLFTVLIGVGWFFLRIH